MWARNIGFATAKNAASRLRTRKLQFEGGEEGGQPQLVIRGRAVGIKDMNGYTRKEMAPFEVITCLNSRMKYLG